MSIRPCDCCYKCSGAFLFYSRVRVLSKIKGKENHMKTQSFMTKQLPVFGLTCARIVPTERE